MTGDEQHAPHIIRRLMAAQTCSTIMTMRETRSKMVAASS